MMSFGQSVYSKDKVYLGKRKELVEPCLKAVDKSINLNGVLIDLKSYCNCAIDKLMPELNSWEIMEAFKNNTYIELLSEEKNLNIIIDCASNLKIPNNFNFGYKPYEEYSDSEILVAIKSCLIEARKDPDLKKVLTYNQTYDYCSCSIEKLFKEGYTMGQLNKIEDEDSEVFNEIMLPCLENSLLEEKSNESFINEYNREDIYGDEYVTKVKLNNHMDLGYKVKINIDGTVKYFLFDTGATDLFINSDMERELIFNGTIKKEDYLGEKEYILADNSIVKARIVKIDNIKIGDYTVNNVIVAVLDNGSLLCGLGILKKFRKWDFNKDSETLNIYK